MDPKQARYPFQKRSPMYVLDEMKAPWFVDLLNINLNNMKLDEAKRRIDLFMDQFKKEGIRITENLDF